MPLPGPSERIDTLVLAGGSGSREAAADGELVGWVSATAARCRRAATVCSGTFLRRRRRHPAGPPGRHPLGPGGRAGRLVPRRGGRPRADLPPGRADLVERRGHGGDRPVARARRGPPGGRCRPDGGPLAGDVPAPARRPVAVRLARLGATAPSVRPCGPCSPGSRRLRTKDPPAARHGRGGGHEPPALHPGLHGRGRGKPGPVRQAHTTGSGRRRELETSTATLDLVASRCGWAAPRPCAACSAAIWACHLSAYRRRFRTGSEERTSA